MISDNCLDNSVLPTPVGPANKNDPIGFPESLRPARESLIELAIADIASFWPKTTIFKFSSRFSS